ncbi:MAG: hypothetical protein KDA42_14200, partial [Planctomycetales bacterium]|nr:hypothetical protein [Planctomycetales bacterium]
VFINWPREPSPAGSGGENESTVAGGNDIAVEDDAALAAGLGQSLPVLEIDDAAYAALWRRTGQAMAVLPDTLLHGDMPAQLSVMADEMRPLRDSVLATVDTLRGALRQDLDDSAT